MVPSGKVASTWTARIISGDSLHDVVVGQQGGPVGHEIRDRAPFAGPLEDLRGDVGDCLRMIEPDTPVLRLRARSAATTMSSFSCSRGVRCIGALPEMDPERAHRRELVRARRTLIGNA